MVTIIYFFRSIKNKFVYFKLVNNLYIPNHLFKWPIKLMDQI